jgi:hypothetical protein
MQLSYIVDVLKIYDSKKGFMRRIFGDDITIRELKKLSLELQQKGIQFLNYSQEQTLIKLLFVAKDNPRLTGYVANRLLNQLAEENLPSIGKLLKAQGIPLPRADLILPQHKELNTIFTNLASIKALTEGVVNIVLKYPDLPKLVSLSHTLATKSFTSVFNEEQLIHVLENAQLYQDNAVTQLLFITPSTSLTNEVIDKMIACGKEKGLLGVIAFLNYLISQSDNLNDSPSGGELLSSIKGPYVNTGARHLANNREDLNSPYLPTAIAKEPVTSPPQIFPSRFNIFNIFSFFKGHSVASGEDKRNSILKGTSLDVNRPTK